MLVRLLLIAGLALPTACATPRAGAAEGAEPKDVSVSSLPGGRLRLSFEPVEPSSNLDVMSREEARTALREIHEAFLAKRPRIRILDSSGFKALGGDDSADWEQHLREEFLSRFGGALLPLPGSWAQSRFVRALKLSPRYMGAGVREAAAELFSSPVFVASVGLSVVVYFAAWLSPEPLFSKAFAVTLTAALALTVGMLEVTNLAWVCLRLYREAESARTERELEAASEHFGKAMGALELRVLVMVASMGLAKVMPAVPPGGLGPLLGAPRYAVEGGVAVGAVATAQVVADGSLIVSGVATGEVAERLCGGLAVCATMDDPSSGERNSTLSTRYGAPHTRQNPVHNETIEREMTAREAAGHTDLRKNKAQLNAKGQPVPLERPPEGTRFRRPDVSSIRPDGVRHNTNYVSDVRDLKRELEAFSAMVRADEEAIHELYLLDGTLVRRHVPVGMSYP